MIPFRTTIAAQLHSELAKDPDLNELLELFVAEMPDRVLSLLDRLDAGDWEGVRRVVHQLKGAAGSYGFEPISRSAAQVEQAIRACRPEAAVRRQIGELVGLCRRIQAGPPA